MNDANPNSILSLSFPVRTVMLYGFVATLWILFSDSVLYVFFAADDVDSLPLLSILKGLLFVLVTSIFLYLLLRREFNLRLRREARLEAEIEKAMQYQVELENSEHRFRRAVEEAPLPIIIFAEDGEVLSLSRTWSEITGYEPEQIRTLEAWTALAYGPRQQEVRGHIDKLFELEGRLDEGEFVINCVDQSQRIWVFSSTPLGQLPDGRRVAISMAADVTERKRLEQEARRQEESFRLLFANNPQPMWVYDQETLAFVEVNDTAVVRYGYSREEFLAMTIMDIRLPQDKVRLRQHLEQIEGELREPSLWQHWTKDGRVIDVEITAHSIDFVGHKASLVVALDVTESEQYKVELYQANQFLQTLIYASPLGIVAFNEDGLVELWNPALTEMLGWTEEEALGQPLPFVPESRQAEFEQLRQRVARGESFRGQEVRRRRKDGSPIELSISAGPRYSLAGRYLGVVATIMDISERKRMEEALRESELRFRQIAENIHEVFYLNNPNERQMLYVSPAYETIWGRSCESLYEDGRSFVTAIHPDDQVQVMASFAEQRAGRPIDLMYRVIRPDKTVRWVRSRSFPVWGEEGTLVRTAGVAEDITELKMQEDALRRLTQQLVTMQEAERREIARELHDEIGQTLTSLSLSLEMIGRNTAVSEQPLLLAEMTALQEIVQALMKRVRQISLDLRPAMLDDLGLLPALRWLFKQYTERTGIEVKFQQNGLDKNHGGAPRNHDLDTAVYRIVQESLTNIGRHAQVSEAQVNLWVNHEKIIVQVSDEGQGFDVDQTSETSLTAGLIGMRERVRNLGGHFLIESGHGRGTQIIAEIPL